MFTLSIHNKKGERKSCEGERYERYTYIFEFLMVHFINHEESNFRVVFILLTNIYLLPHMRLIYLIESRLQVDIFVNIV